MKYLLFFVSFHFIFSILAFEKPVPSKIKFDVFKGLSSEEKIKKIAPNARVIKKRDLASEPDLPHPDYIQGLLEKTSIDTYTMGWDQLDKDNLFRRALRLNRTQFVNYYRNTKKQPIPESLLVDFWDLIESQK